MNYLDIIDMYRLFNPTTEYTFFSSWYGTFSKIEYILGDKTQLKNLKEEKSYNVSSWTTMELN